MVETDTDGASPRRGSEITLADTQGYAMPKTTAFSPLQRLDSAAISEAARKESRRRDAYLPPISTFRWWARRTEAVNGGILDAYTAGSSDRLSVADPFAGGGTIALAAARRNHQVFAQDINPWATLGLTTMMSLPKAQELEEACDNIWEDIGSLVERAYRTVSHAGEKAWISHTFRVASAICFNCGTRRRIFPYAMVSLKKRKDADGKSAFLACPRGHLVEASFDAKPDCPSCAVPIDPTAHYTSGRTVDCPECGDTHKLETLAQTESWRWEVVLVERTAQNKRTLSSPNETELLQASDRNWSPKTNLPRIRSGEETGILQRFGFRFWHDLYPWRQRVVLEKLLETIDDNYGATDYEHALRVAALGTVEMAGLISRWDRWYLKSYEGMANHRFNFTTLAVEPNVWGTKVSGRGTFIRRIRQLVRAASWFESNMSKQLQVEGPLAVDGAISELNDETDVRVVEGSSEQIPLPDSSIDLVLTDPPYHDDIQYDELSLPFRAWAGMNTARLQNEAVVNRFHTDNEEANGYRKILANAFSETKRILKSNGHLIFTYANRDPDAWIDLISALNSAGLEVCGYEILHSDNETDHAKRNVRACSLDLVVDAVADTSETREKWVPTRDPSSSEEEYLHVVGATLLQLGSLPDRWEESLRKRLSSTSFLS